MVNAYNTSLPQAKNSQIKKKKEKQPVNATSILLRGHLLHRILFTHTYIFTYIHV